MKKMWLVVFALMGFVSVGRAQSLGVHGSYVDVRDAGDAYGFGAVLQVPLGEVLFVEARISRYEDVESTRESGPLVLKIDSELTPIEFGVGLQSAFGESGSVWLSGGLYLMRVESDATLNGMPVSLEIEDNEGWYVTLGAGVGKDIQVYAEVQYRTTEAKFSSDNPALATLSDTDLHKVSANLGIRFRW